MQVLEKVPIAGTNTTKIQITDMDRAVGSCMMANDLQISGGTKIMLINDLALLSIIDIADYIISKSIARNTANM